MQKVQNKAIRIALRLPNYINIKLLHEYACLPMIKERLHHLGSNLLGKMASNNGLIKELIQQRGIPTTKRSHRSPLDILLPAQRPTAHLFPSTTVNFVTQTRPWWDRISSFWSRCREEGMSSQRQTNWPTKLIRQHPSFWPRCREGGRKQTYNRWDSLILITVSRGMIVMTETN